MGKSMKFIAVYAYNTQAQRKDLWNEIANMCANSTGPLLIGGDFNSILYPSDRLHGNPVLQSEIEDFEKCVQLNELTPLKMVGGGVYLV